MFKITQKLLFAFLIIQILLLIPLEGKEKNCYEKLGLNAKDKPTTEEITRKFRKLALKYHPDRVSEDEKEKAEGKFKELASCYEILKDEQSRAKYDASGYNMNFENEPGVKFDTKFNNINLQDLFSSFFGGGGSSGSNGGFSFGSGGNPGGFEFNMGGGHPGGAGGSQNFYQQKPHSQHQQQHQHQHQQQQQQPSSPQTLPKHKVEVTLEQIMNDYEMDYNFNAGGKYSPKDRKIKLSIPKGVPDGYIIEEKNNQFEIITKKHPLFERGILSHKWDLYLNIPITLTQSIIGFEMDIPCLDGDIQHIKIKPNELSSLKDYQYQIKKKGLPRFQGQTYGHLYIKFDIQLPKNLNQSDMKEFISSSSKWKYPLMKSKYKNFHIKTNVIGDNDDVSFNDDESNKAEL